MKRFLLLIMFIFSYTTIFPTVGVLDTSFSTDGKLTQDVNGSTTQNAYAVAVQQDGKILVGGTDNAGYFCLARFEQDGTLDTSFNIDGLVTTEIQTATSGTMGVLYGLAVQPDGKIVAVGTNGSKLVVVRYLSDGSLDTSFDGDGGSGNGIVTIANTWTSAVAYAVTIQPADGKIVVAGIADGKLVVARLSGTNGNLDTSFDTDGFTEISGIGTVTSIASSIALTSSGKIICAGGIAVGDVFIAQLTSEGALDNGFDVNGYNTINLGGVDAVYAMGLQSDGKIVCAGKSGANVAVVRFDTNGALDTTFGVSSSGYNVAEVMGGTVAQANGLVIQSDDKIVVTGTVTDTDQEFFIARYLADGSGLDTTFNPTTGYTKTDFDGLLDDAKAIAIQNDNKFVVAGSSTSTAYGSPVYFAVARYLGDAVPQSAFDFNYGSDNNGFITYPTSSTAANQNFMRSAITLSDGSTVVLTESTLNTLQSQLVQLDNDGVALTSVCNIAKTGASDCIVDSQGRIIVIGSQSTDGWIARYTITAGSPGTIALDTDFNGGAILVVSAASSFRKVCENRDGRIIVLGANNAGDGAVYGFTQAGVVDTTFGVSGVCTVVAYSFSDMVINSLGNIYVTALYNGYVDSYDILFFESDGNGGTATASVTTGFDPGVCDLPLLAIGTDDTIYTVAHDGPGRHLWFESYDNDSLITLLDDFNFIYDNNTSINSMTLQQLQCDDQDDLLFTGYSDHFVFVGKTNGMTNLDSTFAPNEEIPGLFTFKYDNNNSSDGTIPQRKANNVLIDSVGAIMVAGHEYITSTSTVTFLGKLVGDQTTPALQAARYPGFMVGSVDLGFGTSGVMSLLNTAGQDTGLGNARLMIIGGENDFLLLAIENGVNMTVLKLNTDYTVEDSFGNNGVATVASFGQPTRMFMDFNFDIVISGGIAGNDSGKVVKMAGDGSSVLWTSAYTIDYCYGVLQQSLSRLIMFGKDGSNGVLVALNPEDGTLDQSFGVDGIFSLGLNLPIVSALVGANNNIIITYKNGSDDSVIQSILPDGSAIDFTFTGTAIPNVSSTDLKIAIAENQKYVLVARNSSSDFIARRYTDLGEDNGGPVTITLAPMSVLRDVMTLNDSSTLILGYDQDSFQFVVARILPDFSGLDTAFGTAGISQDAVGNIQQFNTFVLLGDEIVVGGYDNTDQAAALTRLVYDSTYTAEISQNQVDSADEGSLDETFGEPGILFYATAGDLDSYNQVARAVAMYGNNHYAVALDGTEGAGNKIFMNIFDVDGNLETDFSADGQDVIFDSYNDQYVTDMITFLNPSGVMTALLCGYVGNDTITTNRGLLLQYLLDTGVIDTTFGGLYGDEQGSVTGSAAQYFGVARQSNGRIICAGLGFNNETALLVGYTSSGLVDKSFAQDGIFYGHEYTTGFYSHAIDSKGRIVTASSNSDNSEVEVFRVLADGSDLDTTFNDYGYVGMSDDSQTPEEIRVAVDSSDRIYVGIVYNSNYFLIHRYSEDGLNEESFLILDEVFGQNQSAAASLSIGRLLVDIENRAIICGVMTDGGGNIYNVVIRLAADMSGLDTTFNATGFITYQIDNSNIAERVVADAMITQEGKIVVVGSEV
jgi:uncharacterized delta-60 repeat protein